MDDLWLNDVKLDDVHVLASFSCPWCPTNIWAVETDVEALHLFERHLDVHLATGSTDAKVSAA